MHRQTIICIYPKEYFESYLIGITGKIHRKYNCIGFNLKCYKLHYR